MYVNMEVEKEPIPMLNKKSLNHGGSQGGYENKMVGSLNSLLQSNQRKKALVEFDLLTKSCHDATFSENCIKWLQLSCKSISGNISEEIAGLKLFSKILFLSAEFPELGRQVANSVTGRFLEVFSKHLSSHKEGWNALETLLLKYHGSFATHKELLEDLLKNSVNDSEVILPDHARCFALFPLAGGGGAKNSLYKINWREQFDKLLHTCHKLLNLILKTVDELHVYDGSNSFAISIPEDNLNNLVKLFSNYCLILQSMLLGPFPAAKVIPIDAVLKLISRCLSVSEITLKNKRALITEELYLVLPVIHFNMVQTLSALVVCSKKTLLPVSSTISKILEQALQNASMCKKLAISVYSCLSNWLVSVEGSTSIRQLKKALIPTILNDIQQKRGNVILRGKDKSKEPVRDKLDQFDWDEKICYAALKTLESLINTVGHKLEVHQHKMLQSVLLGIAFDLERGSSASKWMYRSSYRCREVLYSVIIQLCLEPSPHWPPPTQYALKVLKEGLNDSCPSVAKTCLIGTTMLQRIIYPEFSIGSFPQNYQNDAREKLNRFNETSPMELEVIGCSNASSPDVYNEAPTKLVTKASSPWESLSFKKNGLEIEIPSKNDELEKDVLFSRSENNLVSVSLAAQVTMEPISITVNTEPLCEIERHTESVKFTAIETEPSSKIDLSASFKTNHVEISQPIEGVRQKRSGSISSLSSIGDNKLPAQLDSPMSLRSGTILASPSSNETQRISNVSPISAHSDFNILNSPKSVKKNNALSSDDNTRVSRSSSVSSSTTELTSHMSLRSGTLLGSQPSSERTRRSSISSQSSITCSQQKAVHSPIFEDDEIAFDDTVRDDYF